MKYCLIFGLQFLLTACQTTPVAEERAAAAVAVYTSDIDHFWETYDRIVATDDSLARHDYLQTLYFERGTPGLAKLREVRGYTAEEYLAAIEHYPEFWAAIRPNTLRAAELGGRIGAGIASVGKLYPGTQPASVYFAVGAFRTNGTAVDSLVLIGSELALADANTPTHEFPEEERDFRAAYFAGNPIDHALALFVHEYVHTQQRPIPDYLLGQCLYEGVAEYVSTVATGERPDTAVRFGLLRADSVRAVFTREMFDDDNANRWLWSNAPNVFGQRDLGYYIGYAISKGYHERAADPPAAIRALVELDYADTAAVHRLIDRSAFFPVPVDTLAAAYRADRPYVVDVARTGNSFTVTFSEPMNTARRNFEFGPGGQAVSLQVAAVNGWDGAGQKFGFTVGDFPDGEQREILLGKGFQDLAGNALVPYLIGVGE